VKEILAALFLFAPWLAAQCDATPATAANSVSITCRAPAAQVQSLLRILDRIISAQLDPETVLNRLDGMSGGAAKPVSERRVLSAADIDRLTRAIAPFKGQKASIGYAAGDAEASQLTDQIDDILQRAGWLRTGPVVSGGSTARGDATGIDLTLAEPTRATDAFWNGLLAAGLDVIAHINPAAIRDGSISIFVYSRR
jgi:hypothetical protein